MPDAGLKLEALFERWFEDVLRHQVAPSTFSNYRAVTVKHIVPALGKKKISALMVTDVDRLLSSKIDSGLSTSTVRRIRAVLSQCLDQGIRWGVVSRNVASVSYTHLGPRSSKNEGLRGNTTFPKSEIQQQRNSDRSLSRHDCSCIARILENERVSRSGLTRPCGRSARFPPTAQGQCR